MADRSGAALFARIFEHLAKTPDSPDARAFARELWWMTADYDFADYQLGCDDALEQLGLARRGAAAGASEGDDVIVYGPCDDEPAPPSPPASTSTSVSAGELRGHARSARRAGDKVTEHLLEALADQLDCDVLDDCERRAKLIRNEEAARRATGHADTHAYAWADALEAGAHAMRRIRFGGVRELGPRAACGMRYHAPDCDCGGVGGDR